MKKLLGLIAIAVLGISTTFAQTAAPAAKAATKKTTAKAQVKVAAPVAKVETKTTVVKATAPVAVKKEVKKVTVAPSAGLKKDGTPDMRLKANKAAKVAGPKKKDGTADMRYKVNKEAAKKN
ncbi:hypothetical protein [Pedobacter boryungensis]|uniref:Uncharacterized protein n=1 Tax=Pedobacter boryungensis TaxID=869962 RepID=A0ABX2DBD7_9SPHI|nr:hypothetical protein [Pedobacter boryungensis]NQX31381.1 hypothetical protein [Pedobacter boryungensis]